MRSVAVAFFLSLCARAYAAASPEIPRTFPEFAGVRLGMSETQLLQKLNAKDTTTVPEEAKEEEKKAAEEALKQAQQEEYRSFEVKTKDEKTVKIQVDINEKTVYKVHAMFSAEDFAKKIAELTRRFGPPTRSQIYYNNYYVVWNDEKNQRSIILSLTIDIISISMTPSAGSESQMAPTNQQMPQFRYSEISLLDMGLIKKKVERLKQKEPKTEQKPEENPAVSPQPQP